MWCGKYKNITTLITECECKTCFMCEYCEPEDGEERIMITKGQRMKTREVRSFMEIDIRKIQIP